jgi:hypothetical protein
VAYCNALVDLVNKATESFKYFSILSNILFSLIESEDGPVNGV